MFKKINFKEDCNIDKINDLWNKDTLSVDDTLELLKEMLDPNRYNLLHDVDDGSLHLYDLEKQQDIFPSDYINENIHKFIDA
jgi:nucleotidyltransferase/DNA polymerase involved in DNA repair